MSYRESHTKCGKGKEYHASFDTEKYRKIMWRLEKKYLKKTLLNKFNNKEINHLDFACGTGRILGFLEGKTNTSMGIDISPEMIKTARKTTTSKIIEGDLTRDSLLINNKFNLITAFRFFPNAEPSLRLEAMNAICNHLDNDGLLIFNNHRNSSSFINMFRKVLFGRQYRGLSSKEVKRLLTDNNLEIVDMHTIGLLPESYNRNFIPFSVLYYIELFFSKFKFFRGIGHNQIFVCKRL
jgi:predicted TPR repeat methyltransferase